MFQLCIFFVLLFTSVLTYPAINKHTDRFEIPDEFWSHHFGPDFKDAVHFNLQQSDVINPGNILNKHFPENRDDDNGKRSSYVVHTPQFVKTPNRTPENFMKVQLLSPSEIEAIERGMKDKTVYKTPVVVTLPEYGSVQPKSFSHPMPPMVPNIPPVVYQNNQNTVHPQFYQNNQEFLPQNQPFSPSYGHKVMYQQFPKSAFEKTMQPSYEKVLVKPTQPSLENNIPTQNEETSQPPQINDQKETLEQHSAEKKVESSSPHQPPNEKQQQQLQQHVKEEMKEYSYDEKVHSSIGDSIEPSTDNVQPPTSEIMNIQPQSDAPIQPSIEKIQATMGDLQLSDEMIKPTYKNIQPSHIKIHVPFEKIPVSVPYPKMGHSGYMKINPPYENKPVDKLRAHKLFDEIHHHHPSFYSHRMMSYDKNLSPSDHHHHHNRQSSNPDNLERTFEPKQQVSPFDDVLDMEHEFLSKKKTAS